jgi:DNA invertase Pin-like site-specific DNA recombinase
MNQPLRAGLYARVSTADQQTLPMQINAMTEYALRRGWMVLASVQDVNGGTKQRPKREELIKMARRRQLDVIIVWRLDRWGRSLSDLTHSLEELRALKVDFVSVTEGLDFSTPTGRAMGQMLGIFAEFEREVLRDRVRAGLEHAKRKGKKLGRPTTAREKSQKVLELASQGLNKAQIAKALHIGRASVYRALEQTSAGEPRLLQRIDSPKPQRYSEPLEEPWEDEPVI